MGTAQLAANSVTNAKLSSGISASKITGSFTAANLPASLVYGDGSGQPLTQPLTFNTTTAYLRTTNSAEQLLADLGTGSGRVQLYAGGTNGLRIVVNGATVCTIGVDGKLTPSKLVIPVGTGLW